MSRGESILYYTIMHLYAIELFPLFFSFSLALCLAKRMQIRIAVKSKFFTERASIVLGYSMRELLHITRRKGCL